MQAQTRLRYQPLATRLQPIELFERLYERHETAFILESVEGPRRLARYTFLGFDPQTVIRTENGRAEITEETSSNRQIARSENPLTVLSNYNPPVKEISPGDRYAGGLVGYAAYDLVRSFEKITRREKRSNGFPDLEFGMFEDGVVFDHFKQKAYYFYRTQSRVEEVRSALRESASPGEVGFGKATPNIDQERFCDRVDKAKEYIRSGDIFQVVLSKRYKIPYTGSLLRFYRALRKINPSPYMYYLKLGKREVVGSSPEMLARKTGRTVESFPIAGTRPFTADPARNRALASDLLGDEKERAEHVMLVDLSRNDIGKVSEYGTVHVPEFMQVQSYSHVQHIVSRVVGRIERKLSAFDLFRAVFPAGTVTGAPKVRAMEIIDELETVSRGPYAGAVGYFSANGNADFAITIRTLCAVGGYCYIQSGSGIVADSVPQNEWIESERKAAALFTAMEMAQETHR